MIIRDDDIDLLDRFAIAAMSAIIKNYDDECAVLTDDCGLVNTSCDYGQAVAIASYSIAEKMISERRIRIECAKEEQK